MNRTFDVDSTTPFDAPPSHHRSAVLLVDLVTAFRWPATALPWFAALVLFAATTLVTQDALAAQPRGEVEIRIIDAGSGQPVAANMFLKNSRGRPVKAPQLPFWKDHFAIDGSVVTVAPYEHSMLAYGYDLSGIYLIDAGSGGRASYSYETFRTSWGVLGNLAVTVSGVNNGEAPQAPPKIDDLGDTYVVQPGDYLSKLASRWGISWQDLAALN